MSVESNRDALGESELVSHETDATATIMEQCQLQAQKAIALAKQQDAAKLEKCMPFGIELHSLTILHPCQLPNNVMYAETCCCFPCT